MKIIKQFSNDITLFQVIPQIFAVTFKDRYNLCMSFLRYQEYYESPIRAIRNKNFTIFEFMELYSKKFGKGSFTYPNDWDGFNLPINIIKEVFSNQIKDQNHYDNIMLEIINEIDTYVDPNVKTYLIGTTKNKSSLNHELAHGLYYTNPNYKKEMLALIEDLSDDFIEKFHSSLKKMGYTKSVYNDEIQAYSATFNKDYPDNIGLIDIYIPFSKVFKKYIKQFK